MNSKDMSPRLFLDDEFEETKIVPDKVVCLGMELYIEYKNKTQEKCNYCTIYQCISGFYKKNVELHLLLILAIDSLIYSFYVTILLCKKAPVFD